MGERGFTMVELVAVMVLVSVLSVVAIPRLFDTEIFSHRGFEDTLIGDIRFAQKLARYSGCTTRVETTAANYTVSQLANCTSGARTSLSRTGSSVDPINEATPDGLTLSAANIYFDSQGRLVNSGGALLTNYQDISVGAKTLRVEAQTGYVHWP